MDTITIIVAFFVGGAITMIGYVAFSLIVRAIRDRQRLKRTKDRILDRLEHDPVPSGLT